MDAETEARLREMADGQRDAGAEPEKTAEGSTPSSGGRGPSQATVLVGLALDAGIELFHNPASEPFATLPIDGRKETWPLKSKVVKRWLQRLFYESTEKAASNDGTQSALGVLEGKALFDGPEYPVHVRVAGQEGSIFLDLADANWRAVEVTAAGWQVIADPPVKFKRARGMLPLPIPVGGGSLDDLRSFLNFATDDDFRLMVTWLVMAVRPVGPYPLLALHGEQGSGKSTAAEVLRSLVDPNEALLRPPPRNEQDLVIAGSNGRVIALENLSSIPQWCSDALCRISTGAGFGTRQLYSDDEEALFRAQLPIVLNGIAEVVVSGDLQDRSIVLALPRITEYRSEDRLWEEFENQRPALLGALLDAASAAMAGVDGIQLDDPPRMADFATWIAAACPAMGWDEHEFLRAYAANRAGANETTLDASPLVAPLRKLAQRGFEGSATELLEDLARIVGEGSTTRSTVWPKSPAALSTALRRLAPNLRKGNPPIEVELGRSASGSHIRVLSKGEPGCIGASSASQRHFRHKTEDADDASDDADDADDAVFQANSAGDEFDDDEEPL